PSRVGANAFVLAQRELDQGVASQPRAFAAEAHRRIFLTGPLTANDALVHFAEDRLVVGDALLHAVLHRLILARWATPCHVRLRRWVRLSSRSSPTTDLMTTLWGCATG